MSLSDFDFTFDVDAMQQELARLETKAGEKRPSTISKKYLRLPKGECSLSVRILPPDTRKGVQLPYFTTRLHYIDNFGYYCPAELQGQYWNWKGVCPVCEYYNALYDKAKNLSNENDAKMLKEIAKNYKAVERSYYNVIVRELFDFETKKTEYNVGPMILSVGKELQARIVRAFVGNTKFKIKPLGRVDHPLTGRDLTINKTVKYSQDSKFEYPDFNSSTFADQSVLGTDEEIEKWLNSMWDLKAEKTENLKTKAELQHLIDVAQGLAKDEDDATSFNPDDYQLPVGVKLTSTLKQPTKIVIPTTTVETHSQEVPLNALDDVDRPLVEDDWAANIENLQREISNAIQAE